MTVTSLDTLPSGGTIFDPSNWQRKYFVPLEWKIVARKAFFSLSQRLHLLAHIAHSNYRLFLYLSPTGCSYQGVKYTHGDQVVTSEPCLNCTCKKGVLLCFLKVCPTLMHSLSNPRYRSTHECQVIREAGQCCPVMKCESTSTTTVTGEITTTSDTFDTYPPTTVSSTVPTSTLTTITTTSTSTTVTSIHDTSLQPNESKSNDEDLDSHLYYHSNHKEPSHYSAINFHSRGSPLGEMTTSTTSTPADVTTKTSTLVHVASVNLPEIPAASSPGT